MKHFLSYLAIALIFPLSAQATVKTEATRDSFLFCTNEGTAGQKDLGDLQSKYKALADFFSKTIDKPAKLESSQNLKSSSENLAKGRYALFFSKPANVSAKAMPDQKYQLVAKGGSVLFESRKMPFWSLIASPDMSKDDVMKIQTALINLESSEDGKKLLEKLGVKGFVAGNQQDYLDLQSWLEKS